MQPEIIRIIAPLPPKGNVAARHAGRVIHLLDAAGKDVRPATAVHPAYSPEHLCFAPKRAFRAGAQGLRAGLDTFIFYPEGLDFSVIAQASAWHGFLERWRRLGLVARMLWRARLSLVVFRPRLLLKKPDHLLMVGLALLVKGLRPRRVRLRRQKTPPEQVLRPLLGHCPPAVSQDEAELTSLRLAVRHGAKGVLCLSPVWLESALARLPRTAPEYGEISTLWEVIRHFGCEGLPVLSAPKGFITAPPFADPSPPPSPPGRHGPPLSRYMAHMHRAHRLERRFDLATRAGVEGFRAWLLEQAPKACPHGHFYHGFTPIGSDLTPPGLAKALGAIIARARFFGAESSIDAPLRRWLNTPLPGGRLTRLQFLLGVLGHAPLKGVESLRKPWEAAELAPWFAARAHGSYPLLAALAGLPVPDTAAGIVVTGEAATATGLGQNQRMSAAALNGLVPKRRVYLHHVNADAIPAEMLRHHCPGALHIGFLLWELETLPAAHALAGAVLDEVWAPSRFVARIYQRAYDLPVTWVGKGFDLPAPAPFAPARLGLRPGERFFLLSFDLHSSVARKNPLAAVLAFQQAFAGRRDIRLVIKTTPPPKRHWGDPEKQMLIIKKLMARDKRIILLQAHLPFAEYLGLIAAAAALVSPHRSEGFGYVPAYAMALGTPVIATDYGGTQDFCTKDTALLVPWRRRAVRRGESIFPVEGAFWAEVDQEALARAMQAVLAEPAPAQARAARGRALMQSTYSIAAQRRRYQARLRDLGVI